MAHSKGIIWDNVPLGSKPDVVFARELGVTPQNVFEQRKRRGIAPFSNQKLTRSDWDSCGLGERTDVAIAKELGVAPQSVAKQRNSRGIAPLILHEKITKVEWDSCGLGEKPDSEIARVLTVSRETVGTARRKRGIPPFVGLVLLQDGTPCRSIYEAMYDAVLHHEDRQHEHEVEFKDIGVVADLVVEGMVVEIAGMTGYSHYDRRRLEKEEIYKSAGIPVTWLTRDDVEEAYRNVPLKIKTRERFCLDCKLQTIDLVRGVCRPCRMKSWRTETAIAVVCESCGESYLRAECDTKRKFCSRKCYWKSLELGWPSQEEIDALLAEVGNASEVARMLGVKPATLNMRLHRQRLRATVSEGGL